MGCFFLLLTRTITGFLNKESDNSCFFITLSGVCVTLTLH